MATIIQLRGTEPSTTGGDQRTLTLLVGSLLVALAVVLEAPLIGLAVGALFCAGMALARLEQRALRPSEFVAISALHTLAVVLLGF